MKSIFLTGTILLCCVPLGEPHKLSAASTEQTQDNYQMQLRSLEPSVRQQAAQHILQQQQVLEQTLQSTAENAILQTKRISAASDVAKDDAERISEGVIYQQQKGIAVSSIDLLGDLHSQSAIPFLVKNFLFLDAQLDARNPLEKRFACLGALEKIGLPALGPLLEQASETDQIAYQRCSVEVVIKVLGPNLASVYLHDQITEQKLPVERKRLEGMADFMQTLTSTASASAIAPTP